MCVLRGPRHSLTLSFPDLGAVDFELICVKFIREIHLFQLKVVVACGSVEFVGLEALFYVNLVCSVLLLYFIKHLVTYREVIEPDLDAIFRKATDETSLGDLLMDIEPSVLFKLL
jgi:hypothetical protein